MALPINQIIQGDCLKILRTFPDKCIDLILTDPPYNIWWKQEIELHGRKNIYHNKEIKEWDAVNLKKLYKTIFPIFDRILKDNGSIVMFTSQEGVGYAKDIGKKHNLDMKSMMIWRKTNPIPQIRKKNYLSSFECMVWLARWNDDFCNFTFNFLTQNEMHNVFEFPICSGAERTAHPTQKPLELIKKLVYIHSNENDLILDPFCGSGTTCVAAKMLKRNYIGIEINPDYVRIAQERIQKIQQMPLF